MKRRTGVTYRFLCVLMAAVVFFVQTDAVSLAAGAGEKAETEEIIQIVNAAETDELSETVYIYNEEDFSLLAELCRTEDFSEGKLFYLEKDLDLSEYDGLSIPVMAGYFDGQGHRIAGLCLTEEMSDYGLFRYVSESGTVSDLIVEASVVSGGEQEHIGILAGSNAGVITDCISRGSINGQSSVGGIAGVNEETGSIQRCRNEAQIDGKAETGGIAGSNEGTIEDCVNAGDINTNQKVAKQIDGDGSVTVSIPDAVTGVVADERANNTGGIAGASRGAILRCTNEGTIGHEHLGSATGGIVGWQNGSVAYCSNNGMVYGRRDVGGIAGYFEPYEEASYDRDYAQELDDQLDELSDLVDQLGDIGDRMGDDTSDNLDELSNRIKALRDSFEAHMDDFGNLTDDSRSVIREQTDAVKDALDDVEMDIDLDQLDQYISQIEKDMVQIQSILEMLAPYLGSADSGMGDLAQIIAQYEEQIAQLNALLEQLLAYINGMPGGGNTGGETGGGNTDGGETDDGENDEGTTQERSEEEDGDSGSGTIVSVEDEENDENMNSENSTGGNLNENNAEDVVEEDDDSDKSNSGGTGEENNVSGTMLKFVSAAANDSDEEDDDDNSTSTGDETNEGETGEENGGEGSGDSTNPEDAQIAAALLSLNALSEDIRKQVQNIMDVLGEMPDEFSDMQDDFKEVGDRIGDLTDTLDDEISKWSDELKAIKEDLRAHGDSISDSVDQTADTLDADLEDFSDQLDRIKDKFKQIRVTISDSFDELKSTIEDRSVYVDISEFADQEPGKGRIISCINTGEIIADSQAGGIVGTIEKVSSSNVRSLLSGSYEKDDMDSEKDSITKHVVALVADCKNSSEITVQNDYAGGIVGKADYGALLSCENYGDVVSEDGGYVGGIAGKAKHSIWDSYVLCGLSGNSYVGGVAGSGEDISGSIVCVYMDMEDHVKANGAIAGTSDGTVEDNYFVDNGYGAVDGVTRSREAVGMDYASMLELGELPEEFTVFTVRFKDMGTIVWEETFSYGDELSEEDYPELTEPEGEYAYWEEKTISPVHRNVIVHAVYRVYIPSLAAKGVEDSTDILLGGEFYPDSMLTAREASEEEEEQVKQLLEELDMPEQYIVHDIYYYEIDQEEALREQVSLRVKGSSKQKRSLMVLSGELEVTGAVQEAEVTDSYLGVETTIANSGYIVVLESAQTRMTTMIVTGAAILVVLTGGIWILCRRRRKKQQEEAENIAENGIPNTTGNATENEIEKLQEKDCL